MKKISTFLALLAVAAALAVFNLVLIFPWILGQGGPANLGSIEVSYVSMARFLVENWPHLSFAPFWYLGFPFHLFYTPLLPTLEAISHVLFGFSYWQAYRVISGLGFILAPVSLALLAWGLTRRLVPALLAGLFYSFLPSLFYFVLPTGEVAADMITQNSVFLDPRRLVILARWGEGPHTLSLVFLPLAGLFFYWFLEERRRRDFFFACLFAGLTALTNAIGFYALLFLFLAIFFAVWVKQPSRFWQTMGWLLAVLTFTYGLIAFWYNLSFLSSFFGEGGGAVKNYFNMLPWGLPFFLVAIAASYFFFQKIVKNRAVIVSLFWFLVLFLIVYVYYVSAPPEFAEQRLEFAPQALRLMTEVDMALSLLLATLLASLLAFLEKKGLTFFLLGQGLALLLVALMGIYGLFYLPLGQKAAGGEIDLAKTGEQEIAFWLKEHVDTTIGERVFVAGNYSFYLNYFTNIWQLRGGLYQAETHPWPEHIYYQMVKGKDPEIALAWLRMANIKYIVVNTASSRELYKEFEYPEKFKDLKMVYEKSGDLIYQVPLKGDSPAKVVNLSSLGKLKAPRKADDRLPLFAYAQWLEQSEPATLTVVNNDLYKISAKVDSGQGILVQMTADFGFRAKVSSGRVRIVKDPLGFMVLIPDKEGELEIILTHGKTWEIWLGYLVSLIALMIAVLFKVKAGLVSS